MRAGRAGSLLLLLASATACGAPSDPAPEPFAGGQAARHDLYTHCGILETRFEGHYWITTPELHDGSHDPPAGWDNPLQSGTMRRLSPTQAEFRDDAGHVVSFSLREGATEFQRLCR